MTNPLYDDATVEAAAIARWDHGREDAGDMTEWDMRHPAFREGDMESMEAALAVAAPLIAARALNAAADALLALPSAAVNDGSRRDSIGARKARARQDERGVIAHWLRARADGTVPRIVLTYATPSTPCADERMEAVRVAAEGLFSSLGAAVPLTARVWIICDTCGAEGPQADTLGDALAIRPPGWRHTDDGADYCTDCGRSATPADPDTIRAIRAGRKDAS